MFSAILSRIQRTGWSVLKDERGGMAIFLAAGVIAFVGFVGISVDAVRGYLVQSRLTSALDAAGLAGARVMFSPTRDTDIQMFFESNFPPGYLGATVTGPTFTVDAQSEVLTLTAQATIETSFMRVLGFDTLTVAARSEITRQTELLEVVIAIDMSGSMNGSVEGGGSRIDAARTAATDLVNILYGADETKPLLKIGLVPWNGKVNITRNGTTFDSDLTTTSPVATFVNPITGASQSVVYFVNNSPVPLLSAPPEEWKGCAFTRYTDDGFGNDADLTLGPASVNGTDWPAWEFIGPEGEPVPGFARCAMSIFHRECTRCLNHGITALQNSKTAILDAINELTSPTGTTNIPQGLAWAWRVLMPEAPFTEAEANPPGRRTQAIILLTDGENFGGVGDGYKTAFGYGSAAQPEANQRLRDVAAAIKAQGVLIYTIQFAFDDTDLAQLMKDVASGPDSPFYNFAPDRATLQQVFREVANDLSQLRISM